MNIIIDAMGGDNAPLEIVKGALSAHARFGCDITLTGDEAAIRSAAARCGASALPQGVTIHPTTETVESALSAKELTRLLDAFLAELDQRNRMLFVRRYWYADDIPALAERFHMSRNSVSIRLSRIRKKLRDYLQKEGVSL